MKNLTVTEYACALTLLACVLAIGGCNEDINDFRKTTGSDASNEVYIDAKEQTINYTIVQSVNNGSLLYHDGTKVADTLWIKFPVHSVLPVASNTKVSFLRDEALVELYNAKNETSYVQFPADEFPTRTSVTIPEGETISGDSVSFAYTGKLSAISGISGAVGENTYLIPLRILTAAGTDTKIRYDERVCYVVIRVIQQVGVKFSSATFNYIAEIPRVNTWNWNMPFALAKPAIDNDIDVTLEVNNSLITDYNTQNKTTYLPISGDFKPVNLTMAKTASSVNGTLSLADAPSLTAGNYLVPLEIKSVTGTDGAAADNAAKVCYYRIRVYDKETGSESVSVNYTGAAVSTAAEAALGTKQTNRSGYSVEVRDAVTYLIKSPAGTAYPAINMVTNGTGYAYFTSTNANTLNVVIDLGKEVNNISGFELNCYGPTYSPKSYEVSYATEAQFRQGKEIAVGALEDCKQYVYAGISPSVSARYIILRNVTPTQTSGTRYFIWTQFYVYIQN